MCCQPTPSFWEPITQIVLARDKRVHFIKLQNTSLRHTAFIYTEKKCWEWQNYFCSMETGIVFLKRRNYWLLPDQLKIKTIGTHGTWHQGQLKNQNRHMGTFDLTTGPTWNQNHGHMRPDLFCAIISLVSSYHKKFLFFPCQIGRSKKFK